MSKIGALKTVLWIAGLGGAAFTIYHFFFGGSIKGANAPAGSKPGSGSASSSGSSTPPAPTPSPYVVTSWNNLKVGDKLFADTTTYLYTNPNFTSASALVLCKPGEWVGQIISISGSIKKVRNYSVRWGANDPNSGLTDFYIPVKSYKVNNG